MQEERIPSGSHEKSIVQPLIALKLKSAIDLEKNFGIHLFFFAKISCIVALVK